MLISFKRGQASIVLRVKILDASVTTGAGKTGLVFNTSGLRIATIADNEATTTDYTSAGSTIETISTLGTFATPTATKCRFKEVDSTSHPGVYELQFDNTRFSVANAKSLLITISGVVLTSEYEVVIPLLDVDPYSSTNFGMVQLANGVTHGGSSALLNLSGGDASNPSLLVKNTASGGKAAMFQSTFGTYSYEFSLADAVQLAAFSAFGSDTNGDLYATLLMGVAQVGINAQAMSGSSFAGNTKAFFAFNESLVGGNGSIAGYFTGYDAAGADYWTTAFGDGLNAYAMNLTKTISSVLSDDVMNGSIDGDVQGRILGGGNTSFAGVGVQAIAVDPVAPAQQMTVNADGSVNATVAAASLLAIADAILNRNVSNVEASAAIQSLCSAILKLTSKFDVDVGGAAVTYRTDGTTPHMTQAKTTDATLTPVKSLGVGT